MGEAAGIGLCAVACIGSSSKYESRHAQPVLASQSPARRATEATYLSNGQKSQKFRVNPEFLFSCLERDPIPATALTPRTATLEAITASWMSAFFLTLRVISSIESQVAGKQDRLPVQTRG
jgi:hypothetical protein